MADVFRRLALSEDAATATDDRVIHFVFATQNIALDGHRILAGAWEGKGHDGLASFRDNPVFLWCHKDDEPPVGKVIGIAEKNGVLSGSVRFADHPHADTVYKLYRDGFMRGASVSWLPIEYKYASGQNRAPGAIDFTKVNLLEISAVPLPADQSALSVARSLGLSRAKTEEWKCGASTSLPVDEDSEWDGAEAEKSIFDKAGFDGDDPDVTFARKGFLAYDASNPKEKGSYKLPFAKVVDGRLTAFASGVRAAASRLSQTDIPDTVRDKGRAVIDRYEGKMKKSSDRAAKPVLTKRGLYEVASLAYAMNSIGYLKSSVDYEEDREGDDASTAPANMLAVLQAMGKALVEMTQEEVGEALEQFGQPDGEENEHALRGAQSGVFSRAMLNKKDGAELEDVRCLAERHRSLCMSHAEMARDMDGDDDERCARLADHAAIVADHAESLHRKLGDYIAARKKPDDDGDGDGDGGGNDDPDGDNPPDDDGDGVIGRRVKAAKMRAKQMIYG